MAVELNKDELQDLIRRLPQTHAIVPRLKREYDKIVGESAVSRHVFATTHCKFYNAWVGRCNQSVVENNMCKQHLKEKCFKCNGQATRSCAHAGQFVCGTPMCDEHEHH